MKPAKKSEFTFERLLTFLALAIVLSVVGKELHLPDRLKRGLDWVGQFGPWRPLIFIGQENLPVMQSLPLWHHSPGEHFGDDESALSPLQSSKTAWSLRSPSQRHPISAINAEILGNQSAIQAARAPPN
jgi:hypothetical protein